MPAAVAFPTSAPIGDASTSKTFHIEDTGHTCRQLQPALFVVLSALCASFMFILQHLSMCHRQHSTFQSTIHNTCLVMTYVHSTALYNAHDIGIGTFKPSHNKMVVSFSLRHLRSSLLPLVTVCVILLLQHMSHLFLAAVLRALIGLQQLPLAFAERLVRHEHPSQGRRRGQGH